VKEVCVRFGSSMYDCYLSLPERRSESLARGEYTVISLNLELAIGDISSPLRSNSFVYAHALSYLVRCFADDREQNEKCNGDTADSDLPDKMKYIEYDGNDDYEAADFFSQRTLLTGDELDAMSAEHPVRTHEAEDPHSFNVKIKRTCTLSVFPFGVQVLLLYCIVV